MRRTSVVAAGVLAAGAVLSAPLTAGASTGAPIVLGTLPGGAYGKAADVNGAGVVVGEATTAGGRTHAARWGADHVVGQLGTLPGSTWSTATAVNEAGTAIGTAGTGAAPRLPVRWDASGAITALPLLPGGTWGDVLAINEGGVAVGYSFASDGRSHAVKWNADGAVVDLGALPGGPHPSPEQRVTDAARSINDDGVVAGTAYTADGVARPVRWDAAGPTPLATPSGLAGWGSSVNEVGDVLGVYGTDSGPRAARWTATGTVVLGTITATGYDVVGLGDSGTAVGNAVVGRLNGANLYRGVSWDAAGQPTALAPLAGDVSGEVVDATEDGTAIGNSTSARETDRPVRWVGGAVQDLGSPAGATSASAVAAAEGGAVVGFAVLPGFQVRAVLWPAA
ncbi:hypothetical protein ACFV4N_06380 [Actinosynnema sp. NPDC059797]